MPAPPYSVGTQSPSRSSEAISVRMPGRKRCSRSRSRMRGATERAPHSRTGLLQQPVLFGKIEVEHAVGPAVRARRSAAAHGDRRTRVEPQPLRRAGRVGRELEVIGAAEQGAHLVASDVRVGLHESADSVCPASI